MSSHKAFTLSRLCVCVSWICAKIAITGDESLGFIADNSSSGPVTITGYVWVPTLTCEGLIYSICYLTRSCSLGVISSRLQGCTFVSASSEVHVVSLEPWLRMWILFPLEPYRIKYRSKNHVQLYFMYVMYVATGGWGLSKISLHLKHENKSLKPLFDHLIKAMVTTLLSLKHWKK